MRVGESHEITVGRGGEWVPIVPEFSTTLLLGEAWERSRREQVEQELDKLKDQVSRSHLSRFLVGIEEGDEL